MPESVYNLEFEKQLRLYFCCLSVLPSILFEVLSVQHTCPKHQMISDCFAAEDAESFVSQHVDCSVVGGAEGYVAVGIGDSVAEGFVRSGAECFGGTFWVDFCRSPSQSSLCSSLFTQMGQCGTQVHCSVCLNITIAWGIAAFWGGFSILMMGSGVGAEVGGIGQSFLVSNKFSDVDPE